MKVLTVIAVALLIIGSIGLLLGPNQKYIPRQEDLAYIEAVSLTLGSTILAFVGVLWIRKK